MILVVVMVDVIVINIKKNVLFSAVDFFII